MTDNLVTRPTSRSKARTPDDLIRLLRGEECDDCVNNFCTCDVIERAADCIEAQAKRIEQLEEALRDCHHVLHKLMGIVPGNDTAVHEMAEAMKKARAALGEKE